MLKWISKLLAKTADWTMLYPRRIVVVQLLLAVVRSGTRLNISSSAPIAMSWWARTRNITDFPKYQEEFPNQDDIGSSWRATVSTATGCSWSSWAHGWRPKPPFTDVFTKEI